MEISQANLSQHLALMRQRGIVTTRCEGLNVFYKLSNPKIIQACDLMRQVLLEHLETAAELAPGVIPGLAESAQTYYTFDGATKLRDTLQNFAGGKVAVFTSALHSIPIVPSHFLHGTPL